jgi:hypothetical protein
VNNKRKDLVAQYMEQERIMGVYKIENAAEGKVFVGSSPNLPAAWQRDRFMFSMNAFPNSALQEDWKRLGEDAFVFEILEKLKLENAVRHDYKDINTPDGARPDIARDYRKRLKKLEEAWIAELGSAEPRGYNKA